MTAPSTTTATVCRLAATDCDDDDATSFPGATETCDGRDNNCDGAIDEGLTLTAYPDDDGDGFGDEAGAVEVCALSEGLVTQAGDCDDGDARYFPGADESDCEDPNDYNCDGSVGRADNDGDGRSACEDCDDNNGSIFPGATETCDGRDNNCDGGIDEGVLLTALPRRRRRRLRRQRRPAPHLQPARGQRAHQRRLRRRRRPGEPCRIRDMRQDRQ
jgi:hypothetical protein